MKSSGAGSNGWTAATRTPAVKIANDRRDVARGDILRCRATWPYESSVDFMVIERPPEDGRSYALLVVSGYKAGRILQVLPAESIPVANDGFAVSWEWLSKNWTSWGYAECPWDEVELLPRD
jgi:hypothetical protein